MHWCQTQAAVTLNLPWHLEGQLLCCCQTGQPSDCQISRVMSQQFPMAETPVQFPALCIIFTLHFLHKAWPAPFLQLQRVSFSSAEWLLPP